MTNIIQLLPDSIANQIAAGEVVQRPSSAVKELLENAIDAGASSIKIILKNAGKTLIQVVDNGKGMSEMDARMCFERHATSKIRNSKDLFSIQTMGFRGEALASIAAVSQVELLTKQADTAMGTKIIIHGSEFKTQEPCQIEVGTSISVKNLFFNVPARRKFLKSEATEYKHILDEFQRIVLCYPSIKFSLFHNNNEIYHLPQSNLRQRIVNVFGKSMNEKLVPLEEKTETLGIRGFIIKPKFAKKSRGDQYIFVNNRFIKSNYLNHSVRFAFENLIPADAHPGFFIHLDVEPEKIDINVHPTKQEIKFQEERMVYNYIKVAVRHALGMNNLTPALDFEASNFNSTPTQASSFQRKTDGQIELKQREKDNIDNWESIYKGLTDIQPPSQDQVQTLTSSMQTEQEENVLFKEERALFYLHQRYILSSIKSGFILIDQQRAQQRILFEQLLNDRVEQESASQKLVFPENVECSVADADQVREAIPILKTMGWDIEDFGSNSFIIRGIPFTLDNTMPSGNGLLEIVRNLSENKEIKDRKEVLAKWLVKQAKLEKIKPLSKLEMESIIDKLFACSSPYLSPWNKNIILTITMEELTQRFNISK